MGKAKLDYQTIYALLQTESIESVAEAIGAHPKSVANIKNIGDALLADKPKPKNAKPLDQFTPRELMMELANRGYRGKLTYQQVIDINNF